MKNMILNIVLSFLTGLLAYYMVTKTITMAAVWACFAAAVIVALGYFVVYTLKKKIKKS